MQAHQLPKTGKKAQRVGRGGKRGTTSGRGQKGQKSRAGRRIRPAIRDVVQKISKRRGFRNKPKSPKPFVVNLENLLLRLKPMTVAGEAKVTREILRALRILPKRFAGDVKILGDGKLDVPLIVEGIQVSKSVREKIEKAGGRVSN